MNQFLEKEQTHKLKDRNSAGTMDWQAKVIFFGSLPCEDSKT